MEHNYDANPFEPNEGEEPIPPAHSLFDLSISPERGSLLLRKRWQAVVRVYLGKDFRRQDELNQHILAALDGRSPLVQIDADSVLVGYLVASAGDEDRDSVERFARSVASFVELDERAVRVAAVDRLDTSDIDHHFTLPELLPESYDDIRYL